MGKRNMIFSKLRGKAGDLWEHFSRQKRRKKWMLVGVVFLGALVPVIMTCVTLFSYYSQWALMFDLKRVTNMPAASIVYDRNGYAIQRLFEENRIPVTSAQIPKKLKQAVVASEDQRFYKHIGFDIIGIARAALENFLSRRVRSGASTITQQLARNSANMFERTLDRKIREVFLAIRLEAAFSKDEILTLYLNRIFFGKNIYGIGAAAQSYFGKTPQELSLSECAMLAGIISGPNSFSPWHNPRLAKAARMRVLDRMVKENYITQKEADAVNRKPLVLHPLTELPISHVLDAMWDEWPESLTKEEAFNDGLRIFTTVDLAFQRAAEIELEKKLRDIESESDYYHPFRKKESKKDSKAAPDYLQAAFIAIRNADGGILAMIGSRNYNESPFNRAMWAKRQVGSTLKPFVYANLFEKLNATAFTLVDYTPFDLHNPSQAFTSEKGDYITVREALEKSDNYCAMRAGLAGSVDGFVSLVKQATGADIDPFPSSFLGACVLTPLQLTQAYSIFPNEGILIRPHVIDRIEDMNGHVLYQREDIRRRVLSLGVAFQIHSMLQGVVDEGTAASLRSEFGLRGEIAGKTGTTDEYKDAWFVGYTTEVTAGVWVGFDHPRPIAAQGYASRIALPVWGGIMKLANEHYTPKKFTPPPNLVLVKSRQKKKLFFFFDTEEESDFTEYVRIEQMQNSLVRVEDPSLGLLSQNMNQEFINPETDSAAAENLSQPIGTFLSPSPSLSPASLQNGFEN